MNRSHTSRKAKYSGSIASAARSCALAASVGLQLGLAQAHNAEAQGAAPDLIALGVASVAEFPGSSDLAAVPALLGRFTLGPTAVRLLCNSAQLNVLPASSPWALGPVLALRPARDDGVRDAVIKTLRPVDTGVAAGAFVEYSWRGLMSPGDSLTAGIDMLGGKTGALARASLGYQWAPVGDWRFTSAKYQETWFDVDADNARRSGLAAYSGSSGAQDITLSLGASYALSRQWMLIGRLQGGRLLGDAADSPIVQRRGSVNQGSAALAVGYVF
jgi:MipA family protein